MIIFARRTFNGNRILFRNNTQDFLIFRCHYGRRDKCGQGKWKMYRDLVVLIRNVFGSIRLRNLMRILRRSFPRIITFTSSSNVLHVRVIRTNGDKARREVHQRMTRTTFVMRFLRSNLCQDSITSGTIFKRCERRLTRDIRHMFRHGNVSSRLQLRILSFFRYNRTMNIMSGARLIQVSIRRDHLVLRARSIYRRETRFPNSGCWCSRSIWYTGCLFVVSVYYLALSSYVTSGAFLVGSTSVPRGTPYRPHFSEVSL